MIGELVLFALAGTAMVGQPPRSSVHAIPGVSTLGACVANGRPINLRQVLFADNRSIDVEGRRLRIERENLLIEQIDNPDAGTQILAIAHEVSPRDDIDINLQFAIVEGRLSLYWRETYQYRLYRQGIFTIEGDRVIPLCEGEGGIWMSH